MFSSHDVGVLTARIMVSPEVLFPYFFFLYRTVLGLGVIFSSSFGEVLDFKPADQCLAIEFKSIPFKGALLGVHHLNPGRFWLLGFPCS